MNCTTMELLRASVGSFQATSQDFRLNSQLRYPGAKGNLSSTSSEVQDRLLNAYKVVSTMRSYLES